MSRWIFGFCLVEGGLRAAAESGVPGGESKLPLADEDVGVPRGRTVSAWIAELYSAWIPDRRVQLGDHGGE